MAVAGLEPPPPTDDLQVVGRPPLNSLADDLKVLQGLMTNLHNQRVGLRDQLKHLIDQLAPPPPKRSAPDKLERLRVMTLNLQYFSSYPKDEEKAEQKLREATGVDDPASAVDVIAVQEGIASIDVLKSVGYDLAVCSGKQGKAQSVREMVYADETTLKICPPELHDELLCNQIYVRRGSEWKVKDTGCETISTDLTLKGGGNRCEGPLAIRSMVWAKLERAGCEGSVYLMCAHITGGRFEDQYYIQQLSQERRKQPERCVEFFEKRKEPKDQDVGILVGDFNALSEYKADGPMHGYYQFGIATSAGVQSDAEDAGLDTPESREDTFKTYMVSPFKALQDDKHWTFAYGSEIGATSSFGHLIDHMAMSRKLQVEKTERKLLTNQKMGNQEPDTDLPITDHNAVVVSFLI